MQLEVDGVVTENPTSADIARALASARPDRDWFFSLSRDDGDWIEVSITGSGKYEATYFDGESSFDTVAPQERRAIERMLSLYADGDPGWRTAVPLKKWEPDAASGSTAHATIGWSNWKWPAFALAAVLAIPFGFEFFTKYILQALPLPRWADSEGGRFVLLMFTLFVGVFVVALVVKLVETRRASSWPKVTGRITRSGQRYAKVDESEGIGETNRLVADVEYTFDVADKTYRGKKVSFAEIVGPDEVPGTLAKYPEGKIVTVYYDPKNPSEAVLERDMPAGVLFGCLGMLVAGVAILAGVLWAFNSGPDWMKARLPNSYPPLVFAAGFFALFLAMLARVFLQGQSNGRRWPKTPGRVTVSEVAHFSAGRDRSKPTFESGGKNAPKFMPVIEYTYSAKGRSYTSRTLRYNAEIGGSLDWAEKVADRYPVGKIVTVYYDPDKPSRAALEFGAGVGYVLLALALLALAVAVWASGIFASAPVIKAR